MLKQSLRLIGLFSWFGSKNERNQTNQLTGETRVAKSTRSAYLARRARLARTSFQRNSDGNPPHYIVELKVTFRTEQMTVVAVDTDL